MGAKAIQLDFTNVKDGGDFNKKHQASGDYAATITKVVDAKSKKSGEKMWVFTIKVGTGTYGYYCVLNADNVWKVRNLAVAAGQNVPKKRVNVDPNKLINKTIGVTLEDEEYEGRSQSTVSAVFPKSELDGGGTPTDEDDGDEGEGDEGDSEDEGAEEAPAPKKAKKAKKAKAEPEPEEEPAEEAPKKKGGKDKGGKKSKVKNKELEELDIEDL